MSNRIMMNFLKQESSIRPTNGRQTVGDGAFSVDASPSVIAVCHMQGVDDIYYYSTTFSGGPGVRSLDCVTGSPASMFSPSSSSNDSTPQSSPDTKFYTKFPQSIDYPLTPPDSDLDDPIEALKFLPSQVVGARAIPTHNKVAPFHDLETPPLTPDELPLGGGSVAAISAKQSDAALDFLTTLFPRSGLSALPYARSVAISSPEMGAAFEGVVLELPGKPKTLYVDGKGAEHVKLRDSIVALLDLGDEHLQCSALVIALERSSPALGALLHSLMYVGGTVVTKPPFPVDPAYVLVGMEI
ncbi:hypothetical protein BD410DRAFT_813229 [Rickenella mellea]|uniref:Ornithine decarboxylase antizyme n=1 Tax=Rickenella mellea TaxID=50990 RepID=A0A4Y7QHE9_9AGAM|nr:hypothetical protein BD410DRAFT_813229 [Rickenella mellea]